MYYYSTENFSIILSKVYAIRADKQYLLKDAFLSGAKDQDIYLNEIPEFTNLKQVLGSNRAFFHLELPLEEDDEKEEDNENRLKFERFLCEIRGSFPLNFGRYFLKLVN